MPFNTHLLIVMHLLVQTMMISSLEVSLLLSLFTLFLITAASFAQEGEDINILKSVVEDLDNVKTNTPNVTEWSYGCGGGNGPNSWGKLKPEWNLCSIGRQQSPVRILTFQTIVKEGGSVPHFRYHLAPANLKNDGTALKMKWNVGTVRYKDIVYDHREATFHFPSEHTINGKIYPLEMQMLHKNAESGKMLIVSFLFKLNEDSDKFLDQVLNYIPSLGKEVFTTVNLNPALLMIRHKHYYQYLGSLTTPPCTEDVIWIVLKQTYKTSPMQLDNLRAAVKYENARPVQHLYGREVYKET